MIKVNAINGRPEKIPDTKFGSNFDGECFTFWETQEEVELFRSSVDPGPIVEEKSLVDQVVEIIEERYVLTPKG